MRVGDRFSRHSIAPQGDSGVFESRDTREFWRSFLVECNLSRDQVDRYLDCVLNHEILPDQLRFIDHGVLLQLGVSKLGHRLRILTHRDALLQGNRRHRGGADSSRVESSQSSLAPPHEGGGGVVVVDDGGGVVRGDHLSVGVHDDEKYHVVKYFFNEETVKRYVTLEDVQHASILLSRLSDDLRVSPSDLEIYIWDERRSDLESVRADSVVVPAETYFVVSDAKCLKDIRARLRKTKPIYTSSNSPIEVDFIEPDLLPSSIRMGGRIGICMAPGRKKPKKRHIWRRDLKTDLARLQSVYQCDVLVTLIKEQEITDLRIGELFEQLDARGIESIWYPIKDKWIPKSMNRLIRVVQSILHRLWDGKTIVVHCNGGKGRSATVIVACLIAMGLSVNEATRIIQRTRKGTLRNPLQQAYLGRFKTAWADREKKRGASGSSQSSSDTTSTDGDVEEGEEEDDDDDDDDDDDVDAKKKELKKLRKDIAKRSKKVVKAKQALEKQEQLLERLKSQEKWLVAQETFAEQTGATLEDRARSHAYKPIRGKVSLLSFSEEESSKNVLSGQSPAYISPMLRKSQSGNHLQRAKLKRSSYNASSGGSLNGSNGGGKTATNKLVAQQHPMAHTPDGMARRRRGSSRRERKNAKRKGKHPKRNASLSPIAPSRVCVNGGGARAIRSSHEDDDHEKAIVDASTMSDDQRTSAVTRTHRSESESETFYRQMKPPSD